MEMQSMGRAVLVACALAATAAAADVRQTLDELAQGEYWGEAHLQTGAVRPLRVLHLSADSVRVLEVVGAFQERSNTYALHQIESVRVLGAHWIPRTAAPYQGPKSTWKAMGLELVVPGAGFFYIGQPRQGWSLLAFTAAAVATGVLTGKDGAAGWVPIGVWTKAAALAQVRDEVAAMDAAPDTGPVSLRGANSWRVPLVALRIPF